MQVPLSQVAKITQRNGEGTITRENNRRNLTVRIDLADRDLVSYLAEVKAKIAQSVQFDQSKFHLEYAGQFENQERAQRRFTLILGLVLGVMMLLLYTEFGKLRQALLILGIVPLATLGGLIALYRHGRDTQRRDRGRLHRAVRRRCAERHHHGGQPQSRARDRRIAARGDLDRRGGAFPAGADDRDGRDHRHAAGRAGNRRRQRRSARRGDGGHRRPDPRDAADVVRDPGIYYSFERIAARWATAREAAPQPDPAR